MYLVSTDAQGFLIFKGNIFFLNGMGILIVGFISIMPDNAVHFPLIYYNSNSSMYVRCDQYLHK